MKFVVKSYLIFYFLLFQVLKYVKTALSAQNPKKSRAKKTISEAKKMILEAMRTKIYFSHSNLIGPTETR